MTHESEGQQGDNGIDANSIYVQTKEQLSERFSTGYNPQFYRETGMQLGRVPMSEEYEIGVPAVQKIPGVSYLDGDRNNAPVSLHLDSLEQRISMLYGKISGLKMALDPILAPMPLGDTRKERETGPCSPMVQRIAEMDDEVLSIIEYVERISAHVEV